MSDEARDRALACGAFEELTLVTGSGNDLVQRVIVPKFSPRAEVLVWGSRFFQRDTLDGSHYNEVFAYHIVPIPGVDNNGYQGPV